MSDFGFLQRVSRIEEVLRAFKDLATGLVRLTFAENFDSKTVEVTTTTLGTEVAVRNPYIDAIPTQWMVVNAENGAVGTLSRGSTKWSQDFLYFENDTTGSSVFTVRLFR